MAWDDKCIDLEHELSCFLEEHTISELMEIVVYAVKEKEEEGGEK